MALKGKKAVVLIADQFEDREGTETSEFLRQEGATVINAGMKRGKVAGKKGKAEVEVEKTVDQLRPADFDLLVIPGGAAPERLRLDDRVLAFTREFMAGPGVVAAICHGPQVLISAGTLAGRSVTCYEGIRDDVRNAGASYVDKEVVVDGKLITSRKPDDIPAFNAAIARAFA